MGKIEVRPDGSFIAESPEDAVALSRLIRKAGITNGAISGNGHRSRPGAASKFVDSTLAALAETGTKGMTLQKLAPKIGLEDARGFAGVAMSIRKRVEEKANGRPADQFFWKKKVAGQPAVWHVNAVLLKEIGMLK